MKKSIMATFCLLLCFKVLSASPTVSKLETDTRSLKVDIGKLQKKVDSFKDKLVVLEQRLSIPSHVAHDLGEVDKAMVDVKKVASVAKLAPPIKSQSEAVVEGIDVTNPPVHQARTVMDKVAETVEPVREGVKKAIAKIEEIQEKVNTFKAKKIDPFYKSVIDSQSCVDKSDPKHLSCMQKKLDSSAKPADTVIATTDNALKTVINEINAIEKTIDGLEAHIKSIEFLIDGIDLLEHDLSALLHPFSLLGNLFNKKFHVKFPYPDPKNIFKKRHFKISFHGKDIIKGIKHLEEEIKKMIKGALYKAAKLFGLKKLAKQLFDLFNNPFKVLMKKFHLKFKVKIPGLDKIKGIDLKLKPLFGELDLGLKKLDLKLSIPKLTACGELSKTCK